VCRKVLGCRQRTSRVARPDAALGRVKCSFNLTLTTIFAFIFLVYYFVKFLVKILRAHAVESVRCTIRFLNFHFLNILKFLVNIVRARTVESVRRAIRFSNFFLKMTLILFNMTLH